MQLTLCTPAWRCSLTRPRALSPQDNVDLGELMFSLCYLPTAGRLTITVIKARNLKAMDITGASGGTLPDGSFFVRFSRRILQRFWFRNKHKGSRAKLPRFQKKDGAPPGSHSPSWTVYESQGGTLSCRRAERWNQASFPCSRDQPCHLSPPPSVDPKPACVLPPCCAELLYPLQPNCRQLWGLKAPALRKSSP